MLRRNLAEKLTRNTKGGSHKVDWTKRVGSVITLARPEHCCGSAIGVQWDGRKTQDHWPEQALVVISTNTTATFDPPPPFMRLG
jgi:hypothetical protein